MYFSSSDFKISKTDGLTVKVAEVVGVELSSLLLEDGDWLHLLSQVNWLLNDVHVDLGLAVELDLDSKMTPSSLKRTPLMVQWSDIRDRSLKDKLNSFALEALLVLEVVADLDLTGLFRSMVNLQVTIAFSQEQVKSFSSLNSVFLTTKKVLQSEWESLTPLMNHCSELTKDTFHSVQPDGFNIDDVLGNGEVGVGRDQAGSGGQMNSSELKLAESLAT